MPSLPEMSPEVDVVTRRKQSTVKLQHLMQCNFNNQLRVILRYESNGILTTSNPIKLQHS